MIEFEAWPSIPRLFRDCVITEKIDGTNAAIVITEDGEIAAQSRKRIITPDDDNFGFAKWVHANAEALDETLGVGRHFGEWWGSGIQRGYGLTEKRFSLFNVHRWAGTEFTVPQLDVVPVLSECRFLTGLVHLSLANLEDHGSYAAPGFMRPEGIVVYHNAGKHSFKVLIENDEIPKSLAAA